MDAVGEYRPAAICRRGYVVTTDATNPSLLTPRCDTCGAEVLTACPSCEKPIRGHYVIPGVIGLGGDYEAPDFCADCGRPFPWASRQARIYELQNLLDAEDLDPATALDLREQLEALTNRDIDEAEEQQRWERIRRAAPAFWEKSGAQASSRRLSRRASRAGLGL